MCQFCSAAANINPFGLVDGRPWEPPACGTLPRCRENKALIRQSGPDSGLGFQVKALTTSCGVPSQGQGSQFENTYFTEMCSGSEAGSYLRLIAFVSLNARLESNKEEEDDLAGKRSARKAATTCCSERQLQF